MENVKHIITNGCSFTRQERRLGFNGNDTDFLNDETKFWRWPHYIKQNYPNHIVYNLGTPTNDNGVIAQSTIKKISDLLDSGVSPSDIKIIVQWSEQNRNSFFISNDVINEYDVAAKEKTINDINHSDVDFNKWAHLSAFAEEDHFESNWGYYLLTGGYIIDHIHYPKDIINIHAKYFSHQDSAIRFFTNIILLQNFCKVNNIEDIFMFNLSYNFITDNSPGFYDTFEQVYLDKKLPDFIIDFKTDNPYISYLYKNIDLTKFWFYENKYTNVGGQLEWAISEFDFPNDSNLFMEHEPIQTDLISYCMNSSEDTGSTGHVSSEMNSKFVNTILKEFLEK